MTMHAPRQAQMPAALAVLVVGLTLIKSGNVVASKIVVNDVDPFSAVFYRAVLAGGFVVLLGAMYRRAPVLPWRLGRLGWIAAALFATNVTLFYWGVALTDASRVAIIINLQPLVVALLAPRYFPDERLTLRQGAGLLLAFSGVACIVGMEAWAGRGVRLGDTIVFGAMLLWATGTVLEKRVLAQLPADRAALSVVTWNLAFLAGVHILRMLVTGWRPAPALGPAATYAMAYMVTLGSGMFLAVRWVIQRAPVSLVTAFNFLLPVWGVLFSAILLGETLGPDIVAGTGLVAAGIALATRPVRSPRGVPLPAPVK